MHITDVWTPELQSQVVNLLGAVLLLVLSAVGAVATQAIRAWRDKKLAELELTIGTSNALMVRTLVAAAEQKFKDASGKAGKEKLAQVKAWAAERGIQIDEADIEAAVHAVTRSG
ncbi:MAG: hypothetical protein GYA36_21185 [Veillonellaceae bacterium]|nr:hypothetical protein [Veillonellaceae bacterium]